jgi:hypothetical protein
MQFAQSTSDWAASLFGTVLAVLPFWVALVVVDTLATEGPDPVPPQADRSNATAATAATSRTVPCGRTGRLPRDLEAERYVPSERSSFCFIWPSSLAVEAVWARFYDIGGHTPVIVVTSV